MLWTAYHGLLHTTTFSVQNNFFLTKSSLQRAGYRLVILSDVDIKKKQGRIGWLTTIYVSANVRTCPWMLSVRFRVLR